MINLAKKLFQFSTEITTTSTEDKVVKNEPPILKQSDEKSQQRYFTEEDRDPT